MKLPPLTHYYRAVFALAALLAGIPIAHASGSYSAGGGQVNQEYNLGKSAFYKKLVCSSCPLADQEIDAKKAAEIIPKLKDSSDIAPLLSESEREAVAAYLNRRYKLN